MERQKQGFDYELEVIKCFSLVKEENYTGKWDAYYNNIPVSIKYEKFKTLLSSITNNRKDDERWKNEINLLKKEWKNSTPNLIRPRFKRDHKKQKRIQCAINNKDFYNYFIPKYEVKNLERND